jgi:hypothetical protein
MGLKRVPVDLSELEWAMTDHSENDYFLDTETGEIEVISVNMDSDEREEIADRLDDAPIGRYVRIDPLGSRAEYGDMVDFADNVQDKALRRRLEVALDGRGAFRRFKDVFADFPEERQRWFDFRDARMKERVLEWLSENELAPESED